MKAWLAANGLGYVLGYATGMLEDMAIWLEPRYVVNTRGVEIWTNRYK